MSKWEVLRMIRLNNHKKKQAIVLIMDFLLVSREEANAIYEEEFGK